MKFKMQSKLVIALLLLPAIVLPASGPATADTVPRLDYVALGDSLAAGQNRTALGTDPADYKFGIGYPKMVRNYLTDKSLDRQ